jgi:uncharacterized membrane protein YgcG
MHKLVKLALAAGACAVLTGCPTATAVTGKVTAGVGGMLVEVVTVGSTLSPGRTYYVLPGSSITVTYDNGKTCTFTGETEFIPGDDGSVCQKKDNDDNNDRRDDKDKDKDKQDQGQDNTQQQTQDQNPSSNDGANGSEGSSGINAPEVTPTPVPQYSGGGGGGGGGGGIGGPQVIASGVPQYTGTNFVATGTQLLEAVVGIVATKKLGDELDDNDHKDNSGGDEQPPPLSR